MSGFLLDSGGGFEVESSGFVIEGGRLTTIEVGDSGVAVDCRPGVSGLLGGFVDEEGFGGGFVCRVDGPGLFSGIDGKG